MTTTDPPTIGLSYDDDGAGPPLVFLHGGWLSAESWAGQRDRFGNEYRIVVPDLRGHGRTGPSDACRYSVGLMADDLDSLLTELGIEECVLCGLSLGSMVAQSYAANHPERIRGLLLAGAVQTFPPVPIPGPMKRLLTPLPMLGGSLTFSGTGPTFRSLLSTIRPLTGGPWLARDPEVRSAALDTVDEMSKSEFKKVFSALYRFKAPNLEDLGVPARVVYGEHEVSLVKRQSQDLARALDCAVHEIPGAAHLVNQDNPEAFDEVLSGLLAEVES
ncbi:alpha/beta fold hydrolase [Halalkalicoccus subterraneus]|uniref:alpha/beta fold hydrolase n=1 Tax=Halalkalicoccus subterraneus TaxID=2675002 RepID=UPI000EFB0D88|nr:alpha/beta hydrolase [Halalkalicoccus subterraneus]